jgi:hypothetical protein
MKGRIRGREKKQKNTEMWRETRKLYLRYFWRLCIRRAGACKVHWSHVLYTFLLQSGYLLKDAYTFKTREF